MHELKLLLRIKRDISKGSEVDLDETPFRFEYKEKENFVCIYADSFEGEINGFPFPFNAVIKNNLNNANYDLTVNKKYIKMFKSDREITLSIQERKETRIITFEIISC